MGENQDFLHIELFVRTCSSLSDLFPSMWPQIILIFSTITLTLQRYIYCGDSSKLIIFVKFTGISVYGNPKLLWHSAAQTPFFSTFSVFKVVLLFRSALVQWIFFRITFQPGKCAPTCFFLENTKVFLSEKLVISAVFDEISKVFFVDKRHLFIFISFGAFGLCQRNTFLI